MKETILRKFTVIGAILMFITIFYSLIINKGNVTVAIIGAIGVLMFLIGTYRYGLKF